MLGTATAAELSRAFIVDLAARLRELPCAVTWAYWPCAAPFAALVPGATCIPQRGADLGERLMAASGWALGRDPRPLLVLGADVPHVAVAVLREAAAALAGDADVVLGPARDGGYYLLGLRAPQPTLFTGVVWGGTDVLAVTLARARAGGLGVHLLPPTFDVDEPADVVALRALLADGTVVLPQTAAVLAGIDRPGVA